MTFLRCVTVSMTMALLGCGSVDHPDAPDAPATGAGRYTLTSSFAASEGLVLATGTKTVVQAGDSGGADIVLSLTKVMSLAGTAGEPPFCAKGDAFEDVAEVPVEASDCAWNIVSLSANAPGGSRLVTRDGYLVKDGAGALYRLLLIDHVVEETTDGSGNIGSATFDLLPVD